MTEMPPLLLIGSRGMLGRAFVELLSERGVAFRGVDFPELDLGNAASRQQWVVSGVKRVINCAAWTDVDGAETHEAEAALLNGTAVGELAKRCQDVGAQLIHYSTDYVFSGRATEPYGHDQPREPLNAYGRTKALGEELIEQQGGDFLLIRTSWLYAPWGNNFVRTIARLAQQKEVLQVVNDQRGRPTSATHLARTTMALWEAGGRGLFHVTDGGECTWYDLASRVARQIRPACRVEPCTSAAFPRPASRPAYSVLDLSRTERFLGCTFPPWEQHVDETLAALACEPSAP